MVPDALWLHPDLQPVDVKVWLALMLHARDQESIGSSNASLAKTACVSGSTLKRSLARLTATGFVRPEGETHQRTLHLCPDAVESYFTLRVAN